MYIFDFTFNPYALLSILAIGINALLVYQIISRSVEVPANRWFTIMLFCVILWGISEAGSRLSATGEMASFWDRAGFIGWVFVSPLFLGFVLAFIGKENLLSRLPTQLLLFGPALFFLFLGWTTNLVWFSRAGDYVRVYYGWSNPAAPLLWVFLAWLESLFAIALVLLFSHWRKLSDPVKRKQTVIVIAAVLIPVIGGSITDAFLPIFGVHVFQSAVLLTSVMGVLITYAIFKYRLFAISPAMIFSNIIETMNEILVVLDNDHFVEFVNNAVERILGYKKEEMVGQHIKKLVGEDWAAFRDKVLQELDAGRAVAGAEVNLEAAGGKKIPVSFSASLLKDPNGQVLGEVGVASDVRKTHELLTDITAERNKLTTVMGSIADGVLALDTEGNVILVNPAALEILGIDQGDILGKRIWSVLTMYDGDQRLAYKDLIPEKGVTQDTVITQKKNLKVMTSFGKQVFVNLTSSSIKEGGVIGLGAIITLTDVSKEKELEEMKIDFVSMAAHELRTPLTAIRGYLSVLQEEVSEALSREQRSFLDKAFISSSQLASLVENLLSVSKIERGAMKLEVEPTNWGPVLAEAVSNFLPLAKEKGVTLTLKVLPKLPKVLVDKFRISEVLSNLLANAVAYTKPGGNIEVSTESNEEEVTTHVKDTGQGIPEAALPRLFTKFFRVSGVLEQGSKGTGLGLYISKAIVDMHRGKIWVDSKVGAGSIFSFSVPTVGEVSDGKAPVVKETVSAPGSEKAGELAPLKSGYGENKKVRRFFKKGVAG